MGLLLLHLPDRLLESCDQVGVLGFDLCFLGDSELGHCLDGGLGLSGRFCASLDHALYLGLSLRLGRGLGHGAELEEGVRWWAILLLLKLG